MMHTIHDEIEGIPRMKQNSHLVNSNAHFHSNLQLTMIGFHFLIHLGKKRKKDGDAFPLKDYLVGI